MCERCRTDLYVEFLRNAQTIACEDRGAHLNSNTSQRHHGCLSMSNVSPEAPGAAASSHVMPMEVPNTHLCEPAESDETDPLQDVLRASDQAAHNKSSTAALINSSHSQYSCDNLLTDVPDLEWLTDLQGLVHTAVSHNGIQACAMPQRWVSIS